MLNQGNVLAGYSLALVTTVMHKQGSVATASSIESAVNAIKDTVQSHIQKRFNKYRYAHAGDDILEQNSGNNKSIRKVSHALRKIVEAHVRISLLENDKISEALKEEISSAAKPSRNPNYGKVYILLRLQSHTSRPDYSIAESREDADSRDASLVSCLQALEPKMRTEFFTVTYTPDQQQQQADLYHLASRVCGAMVEYKTHLHVYENNASKHNTSSAISENSLDALGLLDDDNKIIHPVNPAGVVRKIFDLRDAMDLVCEGLDGSMNFFPPVPRGMQGIFKGEDNKTRVVAARYKFPFGVWFRGQPRVCLNLMPSLYHEKSWTGVHPGCSKLKCDNTMYDESTLVHNFMAHRATLRRDYNDVFEWLCLMQHYGTPSRVLDWTENILTALYFAVADTTADCDGAVWALNAGRLNEITRVSSSKRYACLANSTDVILRSTMAISRTSTELRRTLLKTGKLKEVEDAVKDPVFWQWTKGDKTAGVSKTLSKLACPVAVFPARLNERESMQLATFTIYGGKDYDNQVKQIEQWERFPEPEGLLSLSRRLQSVHSLQTGNDDDDTSWNDAEKKWTPRGKPFLDVYIVPSCAKRKLREQLKRVGVHIGSLFPELEYQGKYIRHQWRFDYT